eukprot:1016330-Prymnesium_polylepis.1
MRQDARTHGCTRTHANIAYRSGRTQVVALSKAQSVCALYHSQKALFVRSGRPARAAVAVAGCQSSE